MINRAHYYHTLQSPFYFEKCLNSYSVRQCLCLHLDMLRFLSLAMTIRRPINGLQLYSCIMIDCAQQVLIVVTSAYIIRIDYFTPD